MLRKAFRERILTERPWCQARLKGCWGRSSEVHEVVTRARGGSILDPHNVLALCHWCHCWVTEHPLEAHSLFLVRHGWEKA